MCLKIPAAESMCQLIPDARSSCIRVAEMRRFNILALHYISEQKLSNNQMRKFHVSYRVLKSLEFAGSSGEDGVLLVGVDDKAKTLETLLLEKNRTLQTENTQLKVANNELTGILS